MTKKYYTGMYMTTHTNIKLIVVDGTREVEIANIVHANLRISNTFIENYTIGRSSPDMMQQVEKLSVVIHAQVVLPQYEESITEVLIWQQCAINGDPQHHKVNIINQQTIEGEFCVQSFNIQLTKDGIQMADVVLKNSGPLKCRRISGGCR